MPKYTVKHNAACFGNAPYGNLSVLNFRLKTDAKGGLIGADSTTPVKAGDVIVLGEIPQGMRLEDATVYVTEGMTASTTAKLGFAYKDGVNDTAFPQADDYFAATLNLAAKGRLKATGEKLVTLPKDALLILTLNAGANNKTSDVSVCVYGEIKGGL